MVKKRKLKGVIIKPTQPWGEIHSLYLARQRRRNHSELTITKYDFVITEYFEFCNQKVSEASVGEYKNLLSMENMKAVTINKYITILKTFFNWSEKQKFIKTNPGENILFLQKEERLPIIVRKDDMNKLIEDAEKDPLQRNQDVLMFEIFYGCGIRTNELCHVKIQEVNFEKSTLKITEGKGGKERIVAFPNTILTRLKNYKSGITTTFPMNEYLFPNRTGKRMGTSTAYKRISGILGKVLGKKKGAHTLRHSFATVMLEEGAPMKAIQMQLGHASMATTELYTHNTITRLKELHAKAHPKG
jgi:integrase/recombinase XerC